MRRSCKGERTHQVRVIIDTSVKDKTCGVTEVWTPDGVRDIWMCVHILACSVCGRVIANETHCPENAGRMSQQRRWR